MTFFSCLTDKETTQDNSGMPVQKSRTFVFFLSFLQHARTEQRVTHTLEKNLLCSFLECHKHHQLIMWIRGKRENTVKKKNRICVNTRPLILFLSFSHLFSCIFSHKQKEKNIGRKLSRLEGNAKKIHFFWMNKRWDVPKDREKRIITFF